MKSRVFLPPTRVFNDVSRYFIFLAGSIEMGKAIKWQDKIIKEVIKLPNLGILNPRRKKWNKSWKQEITNKPFRNQVEWELRGLAMADLIIFYFDPKTKAPISLFELGLFANSRKVIVCCPEGYYRKGNVDIVCNLYHIKQVSTLDELIEEVKEVSKRNQNICNSLELAP